MKNSPKAVGCKKVADLRGGVGENLSQNSGDGTTQENSHIESAPRAARKGITSAKKLPGHPIRKVDARSLHRILTWSMELNQRQKQLMDAAMEILTNAKS